MCGRLTQTGSRLPAAWAARSAPASASATTALPAASVPSSHSQSSATCQPAASRAARAVRCEPGCGRAWEANTRAAWQARPRAGSQDIGARSSYARKAPGGASGRPGRGFRGDRAGAGEIDSRAHARLVPRKEIEAMADEVMRDHPEDREEWAFMEEHAAWYRL